MAKKESSYEKQDWQKADARVLGQIMATQNIVFALPDITHIAEFYTHALISVPGIISCRVCLGHMSAHAGEMESSVCAECETFRKTAGENDTIIQANPDFVCNLADQPDMHIIAIDSYQHHFGFFVFKIENATVFDLYQPFITNLANYIAISLENRLQGNLLQKAHDELERRVEERTAELKNANELLLQEITERKLAEEAVAASAEFTKSLISFMQDGISVLDTNGVHLEVNPALCHMTGFSREELIGAGMPHPYWPPEEYEHIQAAFQKTLKSEATNFEFTFMRKNGERFQVIVSPYSVKDGKGDIISYTATVKDITERKKMEELVKNREIQLKEAQRLAKIGSWDWDATTDTITWSEEYYHIFGFDPTQRPPGYEDHLKAYTPESAARLDAAVKRNMQTGESYEIDLELARTEGPRRWITARSESKRDVQGQIIGLRGTAQDITQRKQAEEEITWNLAINQALSSLYIPLVTAGANIEQIADIILEKSRQLTSSAHGFVAEIDPSTGDHIAYTLTRMMQTECKIAEEKLREIRFHRGADGLYNGLWGHALNTRKPFYTNVPVKHHATMGIPEGHIIIERFLAVPVLLSGELVGQIALSNSARAYSDLDLDAVIRIAEFYALAIQRKQAEELLRENKAQLDLALKSARMGVWHWDIIENRRYFDDQACHLLGINPATFTGASEEFFGVVHPGDRETIKAALAQTIEKNVQYETEYRAVWPDGSIHYIAARGRLVRDDKGQPVRINGIIWDITERKKAEELRFENLRLEAADKAKSEFLANMSHELRTPLNSSIGFSELLKQGIAGELSEKQEHYVDNILTSNQFLLTLINDILDLSKIETGKIELVTEKMSVPVTIIDTLSLIKEKAMKHKVLLKTEFGTELDIIEADKQRFKQILFNLLSNAVKFSKEEGGTVTITAKKEGGMAQISVSDTGIGIKEENLSRLFHKFEQLESGISEKYGGTGLGLAITKQLVELHGGRIWAQSKYGEGTTFIFQLPVNLTKEVRN